MLGTPTPAGASADAGMQGALLHGLSSTLLVLAALAQACGTESIVHAQQAEQQVGQQARRGEQLVERQEEHQQEQ